MATHIVAPGDTLFGLARRFATTVGQLQELNGLGTSTTIFAGQPLVVPDPPGGPPPPPPDPPGAAGQEYTVVAGDTLFAIARRFGVTVAELQQRNALPDPDALQVGQVLLVSAPVASGPGLSPATAVLPAALFGGRGTDPALLALIPIFERWADTYGVARDLLKALAFVESSWRIDARSTSGAVGLCQLLPLTADWIATDLLGIPPLDARPADPNVRLGARYLRYLIELFGQEPTALAAYFQGPGSVRRTGVSPAGASVRATSGRSPTQLHLIRTAPGCCHRRRAPRHGRTGWPRGRAWCACPRRSGRRSRRPPTPAPRARASSSRSGAPVSDASEDRDRWVLAMHTGRCREPVAFVRVELAAGRR